MFIIQQVIHYSMSNIIHIIGKKFCLPFVIGALTFLSASCQKDSSALETDSAVNLECSSVQIVPLEDALATLENFLKENESGMSATRSGSPREFASVHAYYIPESFETSTRSLCETRQDSIPDAYLVNFANDEGFAVLGANSAVADIVAVTEKGQIKDDLTVILAEEELVDDDDPYDVQVDSIGVYCEEDDDFYSSAVSASSVVSTLLCQGIDRYSTNDDFGREDSGYGGSGGSGHGSSNTHKYSTKSPLLNISWGQLDPYNRYCKRKNLILQKKSAYTGCSTTAMAMIVANNEYPQTLRINGNLLDWAGMKSDTTAFFLLEKNKEEIALLMGSIYNFVKKVATRSFTLITPEQIKRRMEKFGYSNVKKYCGNDLTTTMLMATSKMLADNKPVFISAIPPRVKKWKYGHSWVIDGAKYSSASSNQYLLHFNFGWQKYCNGYFSITCLNPAKGVEYDNPQYIDLSNDYTYTWHFRLITYDVPTANCSASIYFSY